jgi:glycosidase
MFRSKVLIVTLAFFAVSPGMRAGGNDPQGRHMVAKDWWESASEIVRVSINPGTENRQGKRPQFPIDPAKAGPILDDYKARGISAIEIFAPYYGGRSYGGLDAIDRFRLNPKVGTMDDFRALIRLIHSKGMAVISFDNLGYCSSEAPDFLKAEDDVRAGRDTVEARRFIWADSADAPPPETDNDKFFMVRPRHLPNHYDPVKSEFWEYSPRAGKYFWTKWLGPNLSGRVVRLPQYNWRDVEFQQYAERVVRFWMDTGLDGMVIDAVNWYVGHTWEQDRHRITAVIGSYGNTYMQPEGGGAFYEDPVAWIQEGGWNSVQDYDLFIWWEKRNVISTALDIGDPRPIEQSLREYHDRVIGAGGVL